MVNTVDHTVEELIKLWNEGDIDISDGEASATEFDEITVSYEGSDGVLNVTYTTDGSAYRGDTESQFNIKHKR